MTKAGFSPAGFLAENVGIMSTMMDESLSEPEEVRPEHPPAGADRIESQIMSAEERISRLLPFPISVGLFVCILGAELLLLTAGAIHKPFWYDELFTLYLGQIRPFSVFWGAIISGIDPMTPVFMGLMFSAGALPADPHLGLRLLPILGYLLALFGVFLFVRRRYGGAAAIVAVLLICLSPFRSYSIEARPYAMLAGFLAMAAACWQRQGEAKAATPLLYLFFLLGVSIHYYGALAIVCFAGAEALYLVRERKVRWPVWILLMVSTGLVAALIPIAHKWQLMHGRFFWARPDLPTMLSTYSTYLAMDINMGIVLLALASLIFPIHFLSNKPGDGGAGAGRRGFSAPEKALAYSFMLFPAALVLGAMVAGSGYTPRYGWPAILGIAFLAAVLFDSIKDRHVSVAISLAMVLAFGAQEAKDLGKAIGVVAARNPTQSIDSSTLARIAKQYPEHPLVLADGHTYLEMAHYSSAPLKYRLTQLTNSEEALRITGTDSVETANIELSRFVPLNIQDGNRFLAKHRAFILQSSRSRREWLTRYLMDKGYKLRLLSEDGKDSIYFVEAP